MLQSINLFQYKNRYILDSRILENKTLKINCDILKLYTGKTQISETNTLYDGIMIEDLSDPPPFYSYDQNFRLVYHKNGIKIPKHQNVVNLIPGCTESFTGDYRCQAGPKNYPTAFIIHLFLRYLQQVYSSIQFNIQLRCHQIEFSSQMISFTINLSENLLGKL